MMKTVTIYISKQDQGTGLVLTDSEGHSGNNTITTQVSRGDTVIWKLKEGGGIDQITGITPKQGSHSIFSDQPHSVNPADANSNWKGTISENADSNEAYSISYVIDGKPYTDDPELELDPRG